MDLSVFLGMFVALGMILFGIINLGGDIGNFLDLSSVLITVIPTFAALFIAFPIGQLAKVPGHIKILMGQQKYDPAYYIKTLHALSQKARTNGLLSLQEEESKINDPFLSAALGMIVDANTVEQVTDRLHGWVASITERHAQAWAIYEKGAAIAPAFGMVGTLVSLVNMLMNLNFADAGGVSSLGVNMSMAMVTTFYGSLMANVFFIPIGNKLKTYHQKEMLCKKLVIDGILSIQRGENPSYTYEMLLERIDGDSRKKIK